MKQVISGNDILTYPDFDKPFLITTDASNYAIGAVLSQGEVEKDNPIHFASRTLNKREENFSATEKEMLAIYWSLKVFRNYIYGQKFKIITDHQPLTFSLSSKNVNTNKTLTDKTFHTSTDTPMSPTPTPVKQNSLPHSQSRMLSDNEHINLTQAILHTGTANDHINTDNIQFILA